MTRAVRDDEDFVAERWDEQEIHLREYPRHLLGHAPAEPVGLDEVDGREKAGLAWPNQFREARFLSAVDFVQADRFRRRVAEQMARVFSQVDLLLVPSLRDEI